MCIRDSSGYIESMALGRWLTVSETQVANLNKSSIVAISDASIGLKRFYEHCVRKMKLAEEGGRDWEEEEENENIIPFPRPDTDTIH